MTIQKTNQVKIAQLFDEFISSYPYSKEGIMHRSSYYVLRQQGRRNFQAIAAASTESSADMTDVILLQLLPYSDSLSNREKGAWIHIQPCIYGDLKVDLENYGLAKPEDWPSIAKAIFNFVDRCHQEPNQLSAACKEFSNLPYCQGFQAEMLTPILNAIHPNKFLVINNLSLKVINFFADKSYSTKLIEYPHANASSNEVIDDIAGIILKSGVPSLNKNALFNMFCNWLIFVKKYNFDLPDQTMPKTKLNPEYNLKACAEHTGFPEAQLERWIRAINRKKQVILQGPPGTGKTYMAEQLARHLIGGGDGFWELLQFHPTYSYEDFIQGIRPQTENGKLAYPMVPGRFLEFCHQAAARKNLCVLIIDEINRADLSRVFGELMYLLEYRDKKITLAGSSELFGIPQNVIVIGTMNTADRSIALVDYALRRRFAFITIQPHYESLRLYHKKPTGFDIENLIKVLLKVNSEINDRHYEIGHSFFMLPDLEDNIEDIWCMENETYLEDYFFNQPAKMENLRWDKIGHRVMPGN